MKHFERLRKAAVALLFICFFPPLVAQERFNSERLKLIEEEVLELMEKGDIPGLSLVIINGDQQIIKSYGYADIVNKRRITAQTLFELGSTSKAFTALAVTKLEQQNKINLEDKVSDYLPWFYVTYEDSIVNITLRQLLHHTSGIPWNTISKIPQSQADAALEQTIKLLVGQELDELPGKEYQYATINYDVLALVVEKVTKQPFEEYLQKKIINQLPLQNTTVGKPKESAHMSKGYKISFLSPREYNAPVFRGNYAAGYVISNAKDIATWLKFQMGLLNNELYEAAKLTHQRDKTVPLHNMSSYARGWNISLDGTGEIYHGGLNPNFTSYIAMRPEERIGIAVLANSNSNFTSFLGDKVMKLLAGEEIKKELYPGDGNDKLYSGISLAIALYIMVVLGYTVMMIVDGIRGKRKNERLIPGTIIRYIKSVILILPFLYGLYLLPEAIAGFTWESIVVWTPVSFMAVVLGILAAVSTTYFAYLVSLWFPEKNEYKRMIPQILLMSLLSGLSNVVVIIMVTSAIDTDVEFKYLIFYYGLTIAIYLLGRRFVQVSLIKFSRGVVYDLRIQLIEKIFSTSYERFEKLDRGKVYTALNDDINTIGQSTNLFVTLITSVITAVGAFLYLASIAFWATALTIFLILTISTLYYFAVQSTNVYFEEARDSRNVFMRLINGMIDGFKEISLHRNKKLEYKEDVAACADEFRKKISTADIRFVNAFLVGESLLVVLLGVVAIGMSEMFPNVRFYTILSFVIVLLYLIGPVNGILNAVPAVMNFKIAWNRVHEFIRKIPANLNLNGIPNWQPSVVDKIEAKGITYQYKKEGNNTECFSVGPINLEVKKGEILFIIGGNGSGKTTLAKLLTGLYEPEEGMLMINGKPIKSSEISEYFSVVFSPTYLFEKLYNINIEEKQEEVEKYLRLLNLEKKVEIEKNIYSTIKLSGGQRKRLALLQCYLEDSPIYLFDEWAADQDPEYRNFFYRTLLPGMKKQGKIVIAITHDDHYFDVADFIIKMNQGKLEHFSGNSLWPAIESSDVPS